MIKYEVTWLVEHRAIVEADSEAAAIAAADRYSRHNRTEWNTYRKEVKEKSMTNDVSREWDDGVWRIYQRGGGTVGGWMIENHEFGGATPILYDSGRVSLDYPVILPGYVRERFRYMVWQALQEVKEHESLH